MNKNTANTLLVAEIDRLRNLPYSELAAIIDRPIALQVTGDDGKPYQLEVNAFSDSNRTNDVRVIVCCDDCGIRAIKPLTLDFIKRQDGTFVGE